MSSGVFLPDLDRVGGLRWTERTGGTMSPAERRRVLGAVAHSLAASIMSRLWLRTGRLPEAGARLSLADFQPPDSAFAKSVQAACDEQEPAWQAHAYRTWIFGSALSVVDGIKLDPELYLAAALLHDHGIQDTIPAQDFTLRAAERARRCADDAGLAADASTAVQDAITVHLTPGLTVARDGALGTYVQRGAMLDLTGLRAGDVPSSLRTAADAAHPRGNVAMDVLPTIRAQCAAHRDGRLAFACRCGFAQAVRWSPIRGEQG